jgi:hypothetical protein
VALSRQSAPQTAPDGRALQRRRAAEDTGQARNPRPPEKVQALRRGDQGLFRCPRLGVQRAASGLAPVAPSAPDQRVRFEHVETFPDADGELTRVVWSRFSDCFFIRRRGALPAQRQIVGNGPQARYAGLARPVSANGGRCKFGACWRGCDGSNSWGSMFPRADGSRLERVAPRPRGRSVVSHRRAF